MHTPRKETARHPPQSTQLRPSATDSIETGRDGVLLEDPVAKTVGHDLGGVRLDELDGRSFLSLTGYTELP